MLVGVLFGCGIVAFVDEAVFHQLLHWHHFYDRSTQAAGLVSDGVFHAFSWFATVASLFLFADLRRRGALSTRRWLAGILLGVGGFQLFDGLVQHKLLGLHEIRYDVDLLPYDLAWNGAALVILVAGAFLLRSVRRAGRRPARDD
ncbi:putative membrane protein [Arthrobacter agilis]|nr:putative membrane protein [Arthrobacter agilis]